jgi:hypothetical protein
MTDEVTRPLLRVVRGAPTDEELAALTVVLAARAAAPAEPAAQPRSEWRDRASLLRRPLHPGPGAWRASARPH